MELVKNKMIREFGVNFAKSFALASVVFLAAMQVYIHPALAQTVVAPSGGVDFSPIANNVITAVTAILGVAATILTKFAVSWISSKTNINDAALEKLMADRVDDVLHRSIDFASAWAKAQVADPMNSQIKHVQIDNAFVRMAVSYAVTSMPDLIAYFKLTDQRIADMIRSRLSVHLAMPVPNSGIVMTTQQVEDAAVIPVPATANVPTATAGDLAR